MGSFFDWFETTPPVSSLLASTMECGPYPHDPGTPVHLYEGLFVSEKIDGADYPRIIIVNDAP